MSEFLLIVLSTALFGIVVTGACYFKDREKEIRQTHIAEMNVFRDKCDKGVQELKASLQDKAHIIEALEVDQAAMQKELKDVKDRLISFRNDLLELMTDHGMLAEVKKPC